MMPLHTRDPSFVCHTHAHTYIMFNPAVMPQTFLLT